MASRLEILLPLDRKFYHSKHILKILNFIVSWTYCWILLLNFIAEFYAEFYCLILHYRVFSYLQVRQTRTWTWTRWLSLELSLRTQDLDNRNLSSPLEIASYPVLKFLHVGIRSTGSTPQRPLISKLWRKNSARGPFGQLIPWRGVYSHMDRIGLWLKNLHLFPRNVRLLIDPHHVQMKPLDWRNGSSLEQVPLIFHLHPVTGYFPLDLPPIVSWNKVKSGL